MKISVLIIVHNEEKYIAHCIESVLNQTKKADEIVLITHNCTDRTEEIARAFPITVISFSGASGGTYARIEGLKHVSGDIVLCADGDTIVAQNWIEEMIQTLTMRQNILVGSWVKFKGTLWGSLSNFFNKVFCKTKDDAATMWIWGASMGFWKKDILTVQEIFEKSILLSQKLQLTRSCDDFLLALYMRKRGAIQGTNKTYVTTYTDETTSLKLIHRNQENRKNGNKIRSFFINLF